MQPLLYGELVPWYHLMDPAEDHLEETADYWREFKRAIEPPLATLLELGAGAGNNALHLKRHLRCTLTDPSAPMLGLSREQNPECEHLEGDMRTLRLGRTFDAVLIHDAIVYMLTEDDLRAAARTAFEHTRPGGAAIFAPDCVRESFQELVELHENDEGARALRCLEWMWDPDPGDDTYVVEYAFLLRDGNEMRSAHDRHLEGLFSKATWVDVLEGTGFQVETFDRDVDEGYFDEVFLCRRPSDR
ncbi:MAG TPA: class I SAM-dependent methyltransferase [Polyangiaceae bacterium]|nr:class I SAM-dependent methyltransferase [Polyangiaceae bacterium]